MGDPRHGPPLRADWRFLLPDGPRAHTLISLPSHRRPEEAVWGWLVEDRWTDRVTVLAGSATAGPDRADVVFVGAGGDLKAALDGAASSSVVVVEVPASAGNVLAPTGRALSAAGFGPIRRYLATPNLVEAKRLTPLTDDRGLRWLLAPAPFDRPGRRWSLADRVVRLARSAAFSTSWSAGWSIRLASVVVDTLLVAGRGRSAGGPVADLPAGCDDAVLVTSGHDQGSRALLMPLEPGRVEPREVRKISPRPAFNRNVEAEIDTIGSLRAKTPSAAGFLPEPLGRFEAGGGLVGSRERYAGRWTASDLGFRRPETRDRVRDLVLDAATRLATATTIGIEPWSATLFDRLIADPFDRYRRRVEPSTRLEELVSRLASRSDRLAGRPMPLVRRHYDLGPWNVVFDADRRPTIVDWELAPPRRADVPGPAGADHLYFTKYWLHICLDTRSVDDEVTAFEFLTSAGGSGRAASTALAAELDRLGVDRGFVPILAGHIWLEKALYVLDRAGSESNPEPDPAGRYLEALADHADRLMGHWPER